MNGVQLNMATGIREFARATPRGSAVVDGDRTVTFAALDERSNRLASAVLDRGIKTGEPLAILASNSYQYFEIAAAMAKAGIPTVPLNTRNNAADNEYILDHSRARGIFLADQYLPNVDGLVDDLSTSCSPSTALSARTTRRSWSTVVQSTRRCGSASSTRSASPTRRGRPVGPRASC